jgi:hypothetical protein
MWSTSDVPRTVAMATACMFLAVNELQSCRSGPPLGVSPTGVLARRGINSMQVGPRLTSYRLLMCGEGVDVGPKSAKGIPRQLCTPYGKRLDLYPSVTHNVTCNTTFNTTADIKT